MEHELYLRGLKRHLKSQNITYADLAKQLKMTESGVKKMLNAKDISLRRVLKICEVLNVSPGQVFATAERQGIPTITLDPRQEGALIKDRRLLAAYWLIAIEKRVPAEISKSLGMPEATLKTHLQRLVALDLLTCRRGRYRPRFYGKFRWADDSKLAKILNREWSELTLSRALSQAHAQHRLVALKLSAQSFQELRRKLDSALDEAAQSSEREELSMRAPDLQNVSALIATIACGFFD